MVVNIDNDKKVRTISNILKNNKLTHNFSKAWGKKSNTYLNVGECMKYIRDYKKYKKGLQDYIINPKTGEKIGRGIEKQSKNRLLHMYENCIIKLFSESNKNTISSQQNDNNISKNDKLTKTRISPIPELSKESDFQSDFQSDLVIKELSNGTFSIRKIRKYFGKNYLLEIKDEKSSKNIKEYDLITIKIFAKKGLGVKIVDIKIPKIFNKGTSKEKYIYEHSSRKKSSYLYEIKDVIKIILKMAEKNKIFYKLSMHLAFKKYSFAHLKLNEYEDFVKLLFTE
jgi:hypothetical protein